MREQARRPSGNHPDTSGKVPKPARLIGDYKLEIMPSAQIYTLFKEIVSSLGICTKYKVQCTKSWETSHFPGIDIKKITSLANNISVKKSHLTTFYYGQIQICYCFWDHYLLLFLPSYYFYFSYISMKYLSISNPEKIGTSYLQVSISILFQPYFYFISTLFQPSRIANSFGICEINH